MTGHISPATEDDKLEQEARIALLQHYSSKSSNQATIILSLALAFLTFVQTVQYVPKTFQYLPIDLKNLYICLFLWIFVFLVIRQVGRVFLWGELASSILFVKMLDESKAVQQMQAELNEIKPKFPKIDTLLKTSSQSPYMHRLMLAAGWYVHYDMLSRSIYDISRLIYESIFYISLVLWIVLCVVSIAVFHADIFWGTLFLMLGVMGSLFDWFIKADIRRKNRLGMFDSS